MYHKDKYYCCLKKISESIPSFVFKLLVCVKSIYYQTKGGFVLETFIVVKF